ncbi:hypothetical protein J3R83DRAFT_5575, partial [Lanmaoa asiatica]
SCFATAPCQWTGEGNPDMCGAGITCESVPTHFKSTHGVRKLKGDTSIHCCWEGCDKWVRRKGFVRHIRECHLNHIRGNKRSSQT